MAYFDAVRQAGRSNRLRLIQLEKTLLPDVKEKILLPEDVNGEAVVVSKLRSRDANEATEYSKSDDATLACELDTDADASRMMMMMMLSSSEDEWAFVPLLQSLGTAATNVLAVVATTLLTEVLLCISLSTGPVVVVVRGIGALVSSTVRRVSAPVQTSKQVAVDALRSLTGMASTMKLVTFVVCVTTAVLAVCTHPSGATS